MLTNATNVQQGQCELVIHDDRALLALQGPSAVKVIAALADHGNTLSNLISLASLYDMVGTCLC
jgi:glycine cleavage system aminomethyltransferase T